jgi:hypothetical protein
LATILIDRFGRKVLLYISSVAMILSLVVLGTFFYLKDHTDTDVTPYGWLPLVSFVVYVIGFSFGFGPIPWLMMGEILPGKSVCASRKQFHLKLFNTHSKSRLNKTFKIFAARQIFSSTEKDGSLYGDASLQQTPPFSGEY